MTNKSYLSAIIACIVGLSLVSPVRAAEKKENPLLHTSEATLNWFDQILVNWDIFVKGREKKKLVTELQKLETQLLFLKTDKEKLRDMFFDVATQGMDQDKSQKIETRLANLTTNLIQFTQVMATLSAYVPEIHYEGSTNVMQLPLEELNGRRKILMGLWNAESKALYQTGDKMTEGQRVDLKKRIEEDSNKSIQSLESAVVKVRQIRQKLSSD